MKFRKHKIMTMMYFFKEMLLIIALFNSCAKDTQKTFTNPLLPSGPDPWTIYKDGYYYYTNSTGNNITLWKTTNIAYLSSAEKKVVWTPPANETLSET